MKPKRESKLRRYLRLRWRAERRRWRNSTCDFSRSLHRARMRTFAEIRLIDLQTKKEEAGL